MIRFGSPKITLITGLCALTCFTGLGLGQGMPRGIPCVPGTLGAIDANADGDIALEDFANIATCLAGPNNRPTPPSGQNENFCLTSFNRDSDHDIDLRDVRSFLNSYTGSCQGLGVCPPGWFLRHRSGQLGLLNPDTDEFLSADPIQYECVEIVTTCGRDGCSGHGECVQRGDNSACACKPGYIGTSCEQCAVGYERTPTGECKLGDECGRRLCSGQGSCRDTGDEIVCVCEGRASGRYCENGGGDPTVLRPPTRIVVEGTDESIEAGRQRMLTARALGGGLVDQDFDWTLLGPGTLEPVRGGYLYTAPAASFLSAEIIPLQVCSDSFPDKCAIRFLTIDPRGGIKSSGQSHDLFRPFDDVMRTFMRHRCIGAGVLGISVFGKVVHVRGFGNLSGAPTNDPDYLEACGDVFNVSNHVPGFTLPAPTPTKPNSPFRIGSISKSVGAAVLRDVVKSQILPGPNPDDDDVEALALCADPNLLPANLFNVMCQGGDPPLSTATISGLLPDCAASNPCPYGGSCVPLIPPATTGICIGCPMGFGGADCSANLATCGNLVNAADSRWTNVTLGHLLGHRSGLPRIVHSQADVLVPNLDALRGYTTMSHWALEEITLATETGFPAGSFAAEFPQFPAANNTIGNTGYFVRRPSIFEAVMARLGTCLLYNPGGPVPTGLNSYSNTAFGFIGNIAEHVAGISFAGRAGKPGLHSGSLLESFLAGDIGVPIPGQGTAEGMFYSQDVFRLRNTKEPVYRGWSSQRGGTYYPTAEDTKRPHCLWDGDSCDFSDWQDASPRFNWDFVDSVALEGYDGNEFEGATGPAGSLATEAEVFLRFMGKYWTGGDGTNPMYGESRCPDGNCIWTIGVGHNGARFGTWAQVKQLGGTPLLNPPGPGSTLACSSDADCGTYTACAGTDQSRLERAFCLGGLCHVLNEYYIPPIDLCGGFISDDFANLKCNACRLPVGVDIFVAFNQRADKKCSESEDYSCDGAYGTIVGFLEHAACQVQWPVNPFVIWPAVLSDGGSSPGPQYQVGGQLASTAAVQRGLECCGNGVKDDEDEACDGTDFGTTSCASFGYNMGSLSCTEACTISVAGCSGGVGLPPGSYAACGYSAETCQFDPSKCNADGDCAGGPCARTVQGDHQYALTDPFNLQGEFHPDGNFKDQLGNFYYCRDDAGLGEMTCIDVNGWGVCRRCTDAVSETQTRVGCSCMIDDQCEGAEAGLSCFGEDFGGGPGFCWSATGNGPNKKPAWQCAEGTCGMSAWYGNDSMYCEHYSISGQARCEPWFACNAILARVCAGENLICAEDAGGCTTDDCCEVECQLDNHCSPAFGWPAGFDCTPQLECEGP